MTVKNNASRVPQAKRSERMRERLSKAAFNVIHNSGFANFRMSAVSKEAGVSQGAQLHHYPTKDSLAVAAMEFAYTKARKLFKDNFDTVVPNNQLVNLILKDLKDFYFSDYFMVALDIHMAGGKNQTLRDQLSTMALGSRRTAERAWLQRLISAGWPSNDAENLLLLSHNIVRGFTTRSLVVDQNEAEIEFDRLLSLWKEIIAFKIPCTP